MNIAYKIKEAIGDQTIATAESLTAGLISRTIALASGSSKYLRGGVCAYTLDAKANILGVDIVLARKCNGVSETVAREMAQGALELFDADIGISTTGYAEPCPQENVEYPYAYYVITLRDGRHYVGMVDGEGLDREAMQQHVAMQALNRLINILT